jgi:hypothetical protein
LRAVALCKCGVRLGVARVCASLPWLLQLLGVWCCRGMCHGARDLGFGCREVAEGGQSMRKQGALLRSLTDRRGQGLPAGHARQGNMAAVLTYTHDDSLVADICCRRLPTKAWSSHRHLSSGAVLLQ